MRLAAAVLLVAACVVGVGMGVAAADENDDFVKLVQSGTQYYESNSSEYLPWWLHELIVATINPVPVEELKRDDIDVHGTCANWQSEYAKDGEKIGASSRTCFNPDATVRELFAHTLAAQFGNYQSFGGKRVAGKRLLVGGGGGGGGVLGGGRRGGGGGRLIMLVMQPGEAEEIVVLVDRHSPVLRRSLLRKFGS